MCWLRPQPPASAQPPAPLRPQPPASTRPSAPLRPGSWSGSCPCAPLRPRSWSGSCPLAPLRPGSWSGSCPCAPLRPRSWSGSCPSAPLRSRSGLGLCPPGTAQAAAYQPVHVRSYCSGRRSLVSFVNLNFTSPHAYIVAEGCKCHNNFMGPFVRHFYKISLIGNPVDGY